MTGTENARARPCDCRACLKERGEEIFGVPAAQAMMILCETCGNKRCPHATDHRHACTNSNKAGQLGSVYGTMVNP
jgi:hypothetical protein